MTVENNNVPLRENVLKGAKIIASSGSVNAKERPEAAIDGDETTKWCDIDGLPSYIDFDLGEAQNLKSWKVLNAGKESGNYITSQCFLMGKANEGDEWETIDSFDGNRSNTVFRTFDATKAYRYLRLMVTRGCQEPSSQDVRIYEIEVHK